MISEREALINMACLREVFFIALLFQHMAHIYSCQHTRPTPLMLQHTHSLRSCNNISTLKTLPTRDTCVHSLFLLQKATPNLWGYLSSAKHKSLLIA